MSPALLLGFDSVWVHVAAEVAIAASVFRDRRHGVAGPREREVVGLAPRSPHQVRHVPPHQSRLGSHVHLLPSVLAVLAHDAVKARFCVG
eukprot:CAMPEP_0171797202 /NCGR_PEP_ID=MMETSP0991-20121206/69783_1 /TAXON_ID=483369 /ORGANISM="non described non described, Strain CCMP2098" /LENGTH=89 /DNA_ID=CAMNT_0012408155 /DNA_START=153 /DNA_END=419 /DNA_ORIENTATION=+